jgi:hypothetical protein
MPTITKKQIIYIPIRNKINMNVDGYMSVTLGSDLHKKILEDCNGKLPEYVIKNNTNPPPTIYKQC